MEPKIHPHSLHSLLHVQQNKRVTKKETSGTTSSFHQLLQKTINQSTPLKLSKHATERMESRGIQFSKDTWTTIEKKVNEAKQKGVKESLVITDDAALIVSAKNNTVITALHRAEAESQIFTNINGTIII